MPFSETCTSITIAKGVLSAQCKKADGKQSSQASISLNDYIGNSEGKLTWGGRGFSHQAEDLRVNAQGILSAKLKGPGGKMVESQLDLNKHIRNNDGVLEPIPVGAVAVEAKLVAPSMSRVLSTASTASEASASSLFSSVSAASSQTAVSSSSVTKTSSSSYSSSTFHSSKFRATSKLLLIEATCTDLVLKGTILHLKCQKLDGSVVESSINLDEIIGFINGRLEWDHQGFSKHVTQFYLEGFILIAKYTLKGSDQVHIAQIDLRTRLRNSDGVVILMELNKKLSVMLSEVPWMKFKVIAEPDLSVFAKHPVMQETLTRIAETTVEHVTTQMHQMLTIAMESAIQAITQSAMEHVQSQMQTLVADVAGYANASASITAAESLRLYGQGGYAVGGYAAGGYSAGGYYSGGFTSPGLYIQGGAAHSGILNGNGHGVYTPLQSPSIHVEQHGHEHASYSEAASHAMQAGHSVSGSHTATQSAAAVISG